jgi:bifunctional non-homologous end joining protein LigD
VTELLVDGRRVPLTNLDRMLFPRAGFSKADLIDYYRRVAHVLVPHIARRPMTLGRFPDGVDGRGFAQTECRGAPEWLATHEIELRNGQPRRYCLLDDEASLVWAANQSTIELHPYPWTAARAELPDSLLLDLDAGPGAGLRECCRVALILREELRALDLNAAVKTSGGGGLHLVVPLEAGHTFDDTKGFARRLAEDLAQRHPDLITAASSRAERAGRVLIDWLQNEGRRTTAAPYSLRAADYPLVSTPITWEEVAADPDQLWFEADTVVERVERHGDLFAPLLNPAGRGRLPA